MSEFDPTAPVPPVPSEHTPPDGPAAPPARRRRLPWVLGVLALVVLLVGGASYAAYALFLRSTGRQPEAVLPASTIAFASVDVDPAAGQKLAAFTTLSKFPALKSRFGLNSGDDVRRYLFDELTGAGTCTSLDFGKDIDPWLGSRVALAAVDLGGKTPVPAIAVQISDASRAGAGLRAVLDCTGAKDVFAAVGTDYLILSDTQSHADTVLAKGESDPLADDPDFASRAAGAPAAVATFYVAPDAGPFLSDLIAQQAGGLGGPGLPPAPAGKAFDDAFASFKGLYAGLRFSGGGLELDMDLPLASADGAGAPVGPRVQALPADTAVTLGSSVPAGIADQLEKLLTTTADGLDQDPQQLARQFRSATGLTFPDGLASLLGESVVLTLGGDAPTDLNRVEDPSQLPIGLLIGGDAAASDRALGTLEKHLGFSLEQLGIARQRTDGALVLSTSPDYLKALTAGGDLGTQERFRDALPDAARAQGLLYVDLDSGWVQSLLRLAEDFGADTAVVKENLDPLAALGLTSVQDGDRLHVRLRITSD